MQEQRARQRAEQRVRRSYKGLERRIRKRTEALAEEIAQCKKLEEILGSKSLIGGILNSLTAHVSVLDEKGTIIAVNEAWMRFARGNGGRADVNYYLGANYMKVCEEAMLRDPDDETAADALQGIKSVMDRSQSDFALEYPCHSPYEKRWFGMRVSPLEALQSGVVIAHETMTERRRMEDELRKSEERWRLVQESAKTGAWEWDSQSNEIIWPEEISKLYDLDLRYDETTYKTWLHIIHPDDRKHAEQMLQKSVSSGTDLNADWRIITRSGSMRWLMFRGRPLQGHEGKPSRYIGLVMDITNRKRIEEELRSAQSNLERKVEQRTAALQEEIAESKRVEDELKRSVANLRDAQRITNVGSWEWNCKTGNVRWSDGMYTIHGVSPRTFVDIPGAYLNLVHPDDRKAVHDATMLAWAENKPNNMKYRIVMPDGSFRRVHSQGEIVEFDENGKPARMIGTVQDITEREQAAEMIRTLLDATHDVVCLFDTEGKVIIANQSFARGLGKEPAELIGQHLTDIIPAEVGIRRWKYAQRAINKAEVVQFDDERNGHFFHTILHPILDYRGKTEKLAVFAQEITEKKRMASELEKRTSQLEEANREMEAFIYSVSHDLQAPIRAMDGFSRMILKEYGPVMDDEFGGQFNRIRESANKMSDLIRALLNLSRIGRSNMNASTLNMEEIFNNIWADVKSESKGRKIKFVMGKLLGAFGDSTLIRQVVFNLLANAVKFTARKEEAVIKVGSYTEKGNAVYFVEDNGAGFDMAYSEKLFQAFKRLHSSSQYKGTGVGLAIVQRIISRHGGKVWAEGKVDKGATFYFTLPKKHSDLNKSTETIEGIR